MEEKNKSHVPAKPGQSPPPQPAKPRDVPPDAYEELEKAGKKGSLFGKMNAAFHEVLQSSRGTERRREPAVEAGETPEVTADDLAIRRAKTVSAQRMVVPEGVIIDGSMTSGSETEIWGRVDGDVTVDGRLHLGSSALVSGNVRATYCTVEGLVEGKVECSQELELGRTGRLNADVLAGKRLALAGQVFGNITSSGHVRLGSSAKVTGDIRARRLVIEEGAVFNGNCAMRPTREKTPANEIG